MTSPPRAPVAEPGSLVARLMSFVETPRDPNVFAVFRVAFFAGLALHFTPALVFLDENYGHGVVRAQHWNAWLHAHLYDIPGPALRVAAIVTLLALASGALGFRPRAASAVALAGLYAFASFNSLPVQTLALGCAWGILPLFCVCEGASAAWSVDAWLRRRRGDEVARPPGVLANLVLWQLLLTFFFAGVEKVLWGWPMNNEMAMLFRTPRGWILRDWAWSLSLLHRPETGLFLSWLTVLVELLAPVGLAFKRTRLVAFFAYEALFLGIMAMIEVPPLFFTTFAGGILLVLRREDLQRALASVRSLQRRFQPSA